MNSKWLWLSVMMALVLALSYAFFMNQSLRLDEAQSLWQSSRSPTHIITLVAQDVHVPLYHELLHFWRLLVGDSVTSARALSVLLYICCIPLVYAIGARVYSPSVGLFAALLISISPFMNWYGNEIRMYTLLTLVVLCSHYFFLRLYHETEDSHRSAWVGYAITACIGVFVHYFFFLHLLSQALFYFLRKELFPRRALRTFVTIAALVGAVFAPWVWYVYTQGQAGFQAPQLTAPTTVNLFSAFSEYFFGFQNDAINTVFLSLWPITLLFAYVTLQRNKRLAPTSQYLLLAAIVPPLVAFGVSFIVPVFVSRYLIFTVPALYLLIGGLLYSYTPRIAFVMRAGLVGFMGAMLIIEIVSTQTPVKENYREVAAYLNTHATAQDTIILAAPFTVYPIEYYYRGTAPITTLPIWDRYAYGPIPSFNAEQLPAQISDDAGAAQTAWVVLSYDQGYNQDIKWYFDMHYTRTIEVHFSPGLAVYAYQLRYDTHPNTHASSTLSYLPAPRTKVSAYSLHH